MCFKFIDYIDITRIKQITIGPNMAKVVMNDGIIEYSLDIAPGGSRYCHKNKWRDNLTPLVQKENQLISGNGCCDHTV